MSKKPSSENAKTWLDLSEASEILGVHFTTLRRWADAGNITCIRTPGGRRRFKKEDIEQFLIGQNQDDRTPASPVLPLKSQAFETQNDQANEISADDLLVQFDSSQREQFRHTGNRIAAILIQYTNQPEHEESLLDEGKQIAAKYAEICCLAGLTIDQTMQAFLYYKRSFFVFIQKTSAFKQLSPESQHYLPYHRAAMFFDELLLSLVSHYFQISQTFG